MFLSRLRKEIKSNAVEEIKYIFGTIELIMTLFIAPIFLCMCFAGIYCKEYISAIPIAVLDEDQTNLSRTVTQYFNDNERFTITHTADSKAEIQYLLENNHVYGAIYIAPNFSKNVSQGKEADIAVITNGMNTVISGNVYAGAAAIVQTVSSGISMNISYVKSGLDATASQNAVLGFTIGDRTLYSPKMTYTNYMMPGFTCLLFNQLGMTAIGMLLLRNPENTAQNGTAVKILVKLVVCALFLMLSFSIAILLLNYFFYVPIRGNVISLYAFAFLFLLGILCPTLLMIAALKDITKFGMFAMMLSLPVFLLSGYVWPIAQMPQPLVYAVKLIWPFIDFANPFAQILVKGANIFSYKKELLHLTCYILAYLPLSIYIFKRRYEQSPCIN